MTERKEQKKEMEPTGQEDVGGAISQRSPRISSSSCCRIWVVGFLCGVCIANLTVGVLPSFRNSGLYVGCSAVVSQNSSTSQFADYMNAAKQVDHDERVQLLHSAWGAILQGQEDGTSAVLEDKGLKRSDVPPAPHLEDCESAVLMNERFDGHGRDGGLPPWFLWKGVLGLEIGSKQMHLDENRLKFEGAYPPWVIGSDEDNYPLTRKVQRDLWIHQHPLNCSDPELRFLVADWERIKRFGMGAQFASMTGILSIAINDHPVLVMNYFNRADHDGCQGSSRSSWSCYFFLETSIECRNRALELMKSREAWETGIITTPTNYTPRQIWDPQVPSIWGDPWNYMQPTVEIGGDLIIRHHRMDVKWWKAQAIRYLMRFQSLYTCDLMNVARHESFGLEAAKMVARTLPLEWPLVAVNRSKSDVEKFVWSSSKPWTPRPLLSMHVRMGDKAQEMKIVGFENYIQLAERTKQRFPELSNVWLSTEMQEVIDKARTYPNWTFYYSNVSRQVGNTSMATYMASLGRRESADISFVNLIMASRADFFIGAMGSTWCFFTDALRNAGGKVMAGYLTVNSWDGARIQSLTMPYQ